jgi:hypothetical protein
MDVLRAASSNNPDTWKRVSQAIPPAMRSLTEGTQAFAKGKIADSQGDELAKVTKAEAIARMAGFQLTDVSTERSKRNAQRDMAQYWLTRRAHVLATFKLAAQNRDADWKAKAQDALREFNAEAPDRNLKITANDVRESIKRRAQQAVRKDRDLGPNRTTQGIYRSTGELYE